MEENDAKRQDDDGGAPEAADDAFGARLGLRGAVAQRVSDRHVAVPGDVAQREDGREAADQVERAPQVAHEPAERPAAVQLVHEHQRHHGEPDEQVGARQRDVEKVDGGAEAGVRADGDDDEQIAENHNQDDDEESDADADVDANGLRQFAKSALVQMRRVGDVEQCDVSSASAGSGVSAHQGG